MNEGRTVFAQLMEFASHEGFQKCVRRYHSPRRRTRFSCWDQFLGMAFAQLTYRESLRDIEACLGSRSADLAGLFSGISASAVGVISTIGPRRDGEEFKYLDL